MGGERLSIGTRNSSAKLLHAALGRKLSFSSFLVLNLLEKYKVVTTQAPHACSATRPLRCCSPCMPGLEGISLEFVNGRAKNLHQRSSLIAQFIMYAMGGDSLHELLHVPSRIFHQLWHPFGPCALVAESHAGSLGARRTTYTTLSPTSSAWKT